MGHSWDTCIEKRQIFGINFVNELLAKVLKNSKICFSRMI